MLTEETAHSAVGAVTAPSEESHVGPVHTGGKNPDIDKAVESLDSAITSLMENDEGFRNYLTYLGAMHNYSWLNMALIYFDYMARGLEGPIVTMGYKGWKKQGRQVKTGSKAIALFKPILKYWRTYENVTAGTSGAKFDPKTKRFYLLKSRAVGFDIIHKTFHIQDTDGPEYAAPEPVVLEDNSEEASKVYDTLADVAKQLGVSGITLEETGEAHGFYRTDDKSIHLNVNNSHAQQAKTLAHEIAHHVSFILELDHHDFYSQTRDAAEAVVEGAAFIVMSSFGINTQQYSVPYIARWAHDLNKIRMLLRDMGKVAQVIINKTPQGQKEEYKPNGKKS